MRTRPTSSRQRRRRSRSNGRYTGRPDRIALGIVAGTMSHHAPDQASSPSARPTASAFPSHSDSAASTTPRAASQPRSRPAPAAVSSEPDINIEAILAARADMLRYVDSCKHACTIGAAHARLRYHDIMFIRHIHSLGLTCRVVPHCFGFVLFATLRCTGIILFGSKTTTAIKWTRVR